MLDINELIQRSKFLEEAIGKIQQETSVGISEQGIKDLRNEYDEWYTDCLSILKEDQRDRFRAEYEGRWHHAKIKQFLSAPTKKSVLYKTPQEGDSDEVFPYWQHPFTTSFLAPISAQRQILLEASKRKDNLPDRFDPVLRVELIANRFHQVARQLSQRHAGRPTIEIEDEYDVQDLFHGLLKLFFDDVRAEEATPSYAGSSSRIDYLLKDHGIVVELKKTRSSMTVRELRNQLIIDIDSYRAHPDSLMLIVFVYDPDGVISNPKAVENDLSRRGGEFDVTVIISP